MDKCDLSVIVPCYNSSSTLNRAIESVVRQTLLPKEIVCVDDCSDDKGATLKELYRLKNKYSKYINFTIVELKSNKGAAYARNTGWKLAKCKYIAFLDSDDAWSRNKVNIQYGYMEKNKDVYLTCTRVKVCIDDEMDDERILNVKIAQLNKYIILFKNDVFTPSVMMLNDKQMLFVDTKRYAEDIWLWNHIAFRRKMMLIDCSLTFLFKNHYGDSGLSNNMWEMEKGELSSFVDLYKNRDINILVLLCCYIFSIVKFVRRLLVIRLRR